MTDPRAIARQVVTEEAEALNRLAAELDENFDAAVATMLASRQVIVSGIGKSGAIGQKIAGSLTSTGQPAVYMHPVEALHGDLGIVTDRHCLVALSRSGNTDEVVRFVAHFRRLGGPVIGITQGRESRLAELSQHPILLPDVPESGPLQLAPTTSCVLQLAVGDALAMALLEARGFQAEDFAQYHPEGTLGRRLLLRAEDVMHAADRLPLVEAGARFADLLHEMTGKRLGMAVITEADGRVLGTFTDGDLRRVIERVENPLQLDARGAHRQSRRQNSDVQVRVSSVEPGTPAVECLRLMRDSRITSLLVLDETQHPLGIVRLLDLIEAGIG